MEGLVCVRRSFLLLLLLLLLSFLVLVSATTTTSSELPLLPPIDLAQSTTTTTVVGGLETTPQTQVELLMIKLIRTFFGDQVKWSPFIRNDHIVHTHHHRIVHEHRPHSPHLQDELAKRRFRLRGKPQQQQ